MPHEPDLNDLLKKGTGSRASPPDAAKGYGVGVLALWTIPGAMI
jgi:hypothetical protein